jgi:hypothetical protein
MVTKKKVLRGDNNMYSQPPLPQCPTQTRGLLHLANTAVLHLRLGDTVKASAFSEALSAHVNNHRWHHPQDPHCKHSD